MKVKNIYVTDYLFFINRLLKTLSFNNISYVIIKNDDHTELHFNDYIFRIYASKKQIGLNQIYDAIYNNPDNLSLFLGDNLKELDICYSDKEKSGYKKYTRKSIRDDRNNYRVKNRCVGAKSPRR